MRVDGSDIYANLYLIPGMSFLILVNVRVFYRGSFQCLFKDVFKGYIFKSFML